MLKSRATADTFETKDVEWITLIYTKGGLEAIGGKFKRQRYLYQTTDLMWDGDVNPEGFATKYTMKNAYGSEPGILVLDEHSTNRTDPLDPPLRRNSDDPLCTMDRLVRSLNQVIFMVR